jgi:hypothetical protein
MERGNGGQERRIFVDARQFVRLSASLLCEQPPAVPMWPAGGWTSRREGPEAGSRYRVGYMLHGARPLG